MVSRVQAAGRLIQQRQRRGVHQRRHYAELLLIAPGQVVHVSAQVHLRPLRELQARPRVTAPRSLPSQPGSARPDMSSYSASSPVS